MVCEMMPQCEFFKKLSSDYQVVKQGWIVRYCLSASDSERCARKIFRKAEGHLPPVNMTPGGDVLELPEDLPEA
jgi:hypothetical protein